MTERQQVKLEYVDITNGKCTVVVKRPDQTDTKVCVTLFPSALLERLQIEGYGKQNPEDSS